MARDGMTDLIARWRRLVADAEGAVWTDAEAQELLDRYRVDFWREPLQVTVRQTGPNTTEYRVYQCRYTDLEYAADDADAWRLSDSTGTVIAAAYAVDAQRGTVTFTASTGGLAVYLDGRSYDLYASAADAWRERMGAKAGAFDFATGGQSFTRSQWFKHCQLMAEHLGGQAKAGSFETQLVRTDVC